MKNTTATIFLLCSAGAALASGCGGARHRKPVGPPPEYELLDGPDAAARETSPVVDGGRDTRRDAGTEAGRD